MAKSITPTLEIIVSLTDSTLILTEIVGTANTVLLT